MSYICIKIILIMICTNKTKFTFILIISLLTSGIIFSQTDSLYTTSKNYTNFVPEGIVTINQDPKIEKLVDTKIKFNKSNDENYYRIQIYNGPLAGAEETKTEFKKQ